MFISEYFGLSETQPTLDFVDVRTDRDVAIFLDPRPIRFMHGEWAGNAHQLLRSFFSEVLRAIGQGDRGRVSDLMIGLGEARQIRFGYTKVGTRGRGVGREVGRRLADALGASQAARSGLLEDLEDTVLMVPGVGSDLVSDIAANVIRGPLVSYTQRMSTNHGIPMEQVHSGWVWDPDDLRWVEGFVELPIVHDDSLLLVPKYLARHKLDYDPDSYYRKYLAPHLERREIDARTELVKTLKDGTQRVLRKDLMEKYPPHADAIAQWTLEFPGALQRYRDPKRRRVREPLDHNELAERTGAAKPDYDQLLDTVLSIPPGPRGAGRYHLAVKDLLAALFYPALVSPEVEVEIHDGRKRIDLVFDNVASEGFFYWLASHYVAPHILMECKNYSADIANDQLDQLAGRFSPRRGHVGFLLCRGFRNKRRFLKRCRDTADDGRGYVLVLDDDDLRELTGVANQGEASATSDVLAYLTLRDQFRALIM